MRKCSRYIGNYSNSIVEEMVKNTSILFIGGLVPETEEYCNSGAFSRAGNAAQEGVADGLADLCETFEVVSTRPIPSAPKSKTWFCRSKTILNKNKYKITLVPFFNILFVKTFCSTLYIFLYTIIWAIRHRHNKRYILTYNAYILPICVLYWLGKLTCSKSAVILYDLGIPPKSFNLGFLRQGMYRAVEFIVKRYVPKVDGRIVINQAMANDYAQGKSYLLLDGGVNEETMKRLFPLSESLNTKTIFLCAGTLWKVNGILTILDALKLTSADIEVWFAGSGVELPTILEASKTDDRIKYLGMLSLDELFEIYKKADVLMNIRLSVDNEYVYMFPSKIIEYLTVGKYVVTTSVAHIEEVYGAYCHVLKDDSPQILAEAIHTILLMSKSRLLQIGTQAQKQMLETHTWTSQSNHLMEYLLSL